jgi:hypothetical protein
MPRSSRRRITQPTASPRSRSVTRDRAKRGQGGLNECFRVGPSQRGAHLETLDVVVGRLVLCEAYIWVNPQLHLGVASQMSWRSRKIALSVTVVRLLALGAIAATRERLVVHGFPLRTRPIGEACTGPPGDSGKAWRLGPAPTPPRRACPAPNWLPRRLPLVKHVAFLALDDTGFALLEGR